MQDLFGSVRRSLVFRTPNSDEDAGAGAGIGGFVDKIGASIRSSRIGLFTKQSPVRALLPPSPAKENLPPMGEDGRISPAPVRKLAPVKDEARLRETRLEEDVVAIRWRKGELIGCGAFGRVYMGMNLDSGELLAVKQVLIANSGASKEKTQAHIRELEEEVNLLKNLSHPNIVRYLGTAREEEALNILLEFVPGGSISSLLGKFGSFPEPVIRMYTKQLLLGLEYLHKNGIMHRDIKGANILVDNKGCIKLADFGASKKVVELATMTGAKSMKGTPYWMAPEVILQTGHSFSADIWSVGCTVIEMATGKPPWSQQFQEVAALFHIGTTKSHPPIPEQLSTEAKNFLLKCLQKEPNLRPLASDLLEHPFVIGEYRESHPVYRPPTTEEAGNHNASPQIEQKSIKSHLKKTISGGLKDICNMGSVRCSTVYPEKFSGACSLWDTDGDDDMCLLDDKDEFEFGTSEKLNTALLVDDLCQSFNPICEPNDDWPCNSVENPNVRRREASLLSRDASGPTETCNEETEFAFPSGASADDDDEVTEFKIKAFLDEKALELKKLQTPLYKEFYNSLNSASPVDFGATDCDNLVNDLPSKIKSPRRVHSRRLSNTTDIANTTSPGSRGKYVPDSSGIMEKPLKEHPEKELQEGFSLSPSFSERQRIWKEELAKELEIQRERLRLAGVGGKISSPNKRLPSQRERLPFASPAK